LQQALAVPPELARPRTAVVLAAGRSERLQEVTGGGSKALVRLGGLAMIERVVRTLLGSGLERVVVVIGYQAGPVAAVVGRVAPGKVRTLYAEGWEAGNGASLAAAAQAVAGEGLFVLLTSDHVFGEGALHDLLRAGEPAVLADSTPSLDAWSEGTKVRVRKGLALGFGKGLDDPWIDCGVFLLPPDVFECQRRAAAEGDCSLAGALTRLAEARPLLAVPLPRECWWQDVDTPKDLQVARTSLRGSLGKEGDGPVSRYLNRPISTRLSMVLAPLRLSPDLVSVVVALVAVAAAWLLASGDGVLGGALAQVTSVLDGVDGELARLQVRAGPRGALLDGVLDRLTDAAILAGLGIWALDSSQSPSVVLGLTVAATAGAMLSMASKDRVAALGLLPAPERAIGFLLGSRDGRLLLVAIGAILHQPLLALAAVTATSWLSLALRVLLVRRGSLRFERARYRPGPGHRPPVPPVAPPAGSSPGRRGQDPTP
jgi:1L-myo-inositol 1-phosphate cytidylyltransferase / CDP-L-myo-inositol myo-inositolphosphotransferase